MPLLSRIVVVGVILSLIGCAPQPDPHPVQGDAWVVDQASMFTESGRSRLRRILQRIHKSTGAQFVVATAIRAGADPRAKALELFNTWKLGTRADNNGILLLISRDDRAVEILTGTGFESKLPAPWLRDLLRTTVTPQLRAGNAEEAAVSGAKQIGAKLQGFEGGFPQSAFLLLTLASAIVGLGGAAYLFRQLFAPLLIPPTGKRVHERDLRKMRHESFLRFEAEAVDANNSRRYSKPAMLAAWLGLSLCGAALAGVLATVSPEFASLEPWFTVLWIIAFASSALTTVALQPHTGGLQELTVILAPIAFLAAMPAGYIANHFASPFTSAVIVLPLFTLAVNALAGWYWYRESAGSLVSVDRVACAKCKSVPVAIDPTKFLSQWEGHALRNDRVSVLGWHCAKCFAAPKSNTEVYLSCGVIRKNAVCEKCKQFAVEALREKKNQQSLVCKACGHKRPDPDWNPSQPKTIPGYVAGGSSYEPAPRESSDVELNTWDSSSTYDPPEAGGSTSGNGASDNW